MAGCELKMTAAACGRWLADGVDARGRFRQSRCRRTDTFVGVGPPLPAGVTPVPDPPTPLTVATSVSPIMSVTALVAPECRWRAHPPGSRRTPHAGGTGTLRAIEPLRAIA
jgi:hypothetical protein